MLAILIVLPLIAAAIAAQLMRGKSKNYIRYAALGASLITLALIVSAYYNTAQIQSVTWFSFSGYQFSLSTSTMPLNMLLMFIVGIITPLIITYSMGFMNTPSEQQRYYSELMVFAAAMLLFAMSADFITMLIGWELLGITSYLLIGFWQQREGTAYAARKSITTIIIGDVLMLIAALLIWNSLHTFSFSAILSSAGTSSGIGIALVLVLLAVFTKSAQFPFHEWLPDAMKGPTPVSAFLHSSTMVKAGVFLIAVLLPIFIAYHLLYLIVIFGAITSILGAANALTESHVKKILAYSTIEDLGLMFVALGFGSVIAAMMLFVVQTFYKALLFMGAGALMRVNNNEEKIEKMYNSPYMWKIFIPTIIAVFSLAGMFPFSGFFGKAAVDLSSGNIIAYLLLLAIGFVSNLYIFRWLFVPLHTRNDRKSIEARTNYRILPRSMLISMYILAALVFAASAAYIYLPRYLSSGALAIGNAEIAVSYVLIIAGMAMAYYLFYHNGKYTLNEDSPLYKILYNNVFINAFYLKVTQSVSAIASTVDKIDYALYGIIKQVTQSAGEIGNEIKRIEDGNMNTYVAVFVIGFLLILILFIL